MSSVLKGVSEFYPITFDSAHFSALNVVVHSALMGKLFYNKTLISKLILFIVDFKFR